MPIDVTLDQLQSIASDRQMTGVHSLDRNENRRILLAPSRHHVLLHM
jgi:hypothetical protein